LVYNSNVLPRCFGDYLLIAANRFTTQTYVDQDRNVWTYRFDIQLAGNPEYLGVYHGTDIPFWFNIPTTIYTEKENATSQFMARSWISFIHDLGAELGSKFPTWPKFNNGSANMVFKEGRCLEKADFREEGISLINEHLLEFVS
jgi:carboxylesterase type B